MDSRMHREAELEVTEHAIDAIAKDPAQAEKMKASYRRYEQARALMRGGSVDDPIEPVQGITRIEGIGPSGGTTEA